MSTLQNQAINELWRQGLHMQAGRAERCWEAGREFSLEISIDVPLSMRQLLDQCNREATG